MQGRLRKPLTVIAALAGALVLSGTAGAQEDCPRGTLDKAYCDRDGDLTADLPTDPKKIINPSTLIFSYTPVEDPAVYQKVWDSFIKNLEKTTGKNSSEEMLHIPVKAKNYETSKWEEMDYLFTQGDCK